MKKRWAALLLAFSVTISAAISGEPAAVVLAAEAEGAKEPEQVENAEARRKPREAVLMESEEEIIRESTLKADAKEEEEPVLPTGLLPIQMIDVGAIDASQVYDEAEGENELGTGLYASKTYGNDWDKYSTNYFYNQLSSEEQAIWDEMDDVCLRYLTNSINVEKYQGYYLTDFVRCGGLDEVDVEDMVDLAYIFRYSNPQYYFLTTGLAPGTLGDELYIAFEFYPAFTKGSVRTKETAKVKKQAEKWVTMASAYGSEEQKVKALHDAIVEKVDYDDYFLTLGREEQSAYEQTAYTQSAYSVFCTDTTVCAGYSMALEMVLNGAGIDSISVTSGDHQWNKVRINDSWYNVDATWADQSWGIYYGFYVRSDVVYDAGEPEEVYSHTEQDFWNAYLPICSQDSGSTTLEAGTPPMPTAAATTPAIRITKNGSKNKISITCDTPGAMIYYTTDGTEPSQAFTKSRLYTKAFNLKEAATIKAVAVRDTYWDSAVASSEAKISFKVAFKGNGSTSGKMSTQSMTYGSGKKLTANAFKRKGYTFKGWNTKADGSGKSYKNKADGSKLTKTGGKTVTLYAQWSKTKYTITYKLNGGTNSSKNPTKYYVTTKTIKLRNPTRKGYQFVGWYQDAKYKKQITQIKKGSTGNLKLYAKWKKK